MFKVNVTNTKIKTLKRGDRGFTIVTDGFTVSPRAGFQINNKCPKEYKMIIAECINYGWIEPVAFMTEQEFAWDELKK
jgi:hypothetical protein